MDVIRKHWYDIGAVLSMIVLIYIALWTNLTYYNYVTWFSLISLFLHQLEEYRIVWTFPWMVNKVMYKSTTPDRYPLNTNTALYINVYIWWTFYFFAAFYWEKAIWLGIATILISIGNTFGHGILFNIKGKTFYNAGLATSLLLFVPCIYFFFFVIHTENLVTPLDYLIGIPLGIVLNFIGIIKFIDWFADKNTGFIFEQRNLLPEDRVGHFYKNELDK